jgi:hypothetical protein
MLVILAALGAVLLVWRRRSNPPSTPPPAAAAEPSVAVAPAAAYPFGSYASAPPSTWSSSTGSKPAAGYRQGEVVVFSVGR